MKSIISAVLATSLILPSAFSEQTPDNSASIEQARQLLEDLGDSAFASPEQTPDLAALRESLRQDIETMQFDDDPIGKEPARSLFGTNPLTGDRNPLLNDRSRQIWLASAIDKLGVEMVSAHLREQASAMASGDVDRADWYEHVATCTDLCNPVVQGLLFEHIRQVAARPHLLATFATNRADLTPSAAHQLKAFVQREVDRDPSIQFLLIGRASRTGARVYNRELSARRVQSVRSFVTAQKISGDRITGFWLGYEPPQISEEIVASYGLSAELDHQARNQSVLIVAFSAADSAQATEA
ncbi:MAG: OmpA family protein [bacterium]|nr:OmpA family protein [bacterium]